MKTLHKRVADLKRASKAINYREFLANPNLKISTDEKDGEMLVKGYLSVWGIKDSYDTIMMKGCCAKSINERGPESPSKQKIAHLWQHKMDEPLAQYRVLIEDDYGLYFEAAYDDIPLAERAYTQLQSGTLNQFSIGFLYVWDKVEYDENVDAIIVREIDLFEGSVVTIGSNSETYAMRTPEQYADQLDSYQQDMETYIRTLPRRQQLELRELLNRHESLINSKPEKPLGESKPKDVKESFYGYKLKL